MKCENYNCPYHDCLSPDCRYLNVIKNGGDFGKKHCNKIHLKKQTFMKTTLSIIGIIALFLIIMSGMSNGCSNNQDVLNDLQIKHQTLNQRIDTMQIKLDQIDYLVNQIDVKADTISNRQNRIYKKISYMNKSIDTLKAGQIVIYSQITSGTNSKTVKGNWADGVIDYLIK